MNDMIRVDLADKKYTIIQDSSGRSRLLRYGDEWRDVTGDNVILAAAYEIDALRQRVAKLESALGLALKMHEEWIEAQDEGYAGAYYSFVKCKSKEWEVIRKAKEFAP